MTFNSLPGFNTQSHISRSSATKLKAQYDKHDVSM